MCPSCQVASCPEMENPALSKTSFKECLEVEMYENWLVFKYNSPPSISLDICEGACCSDTEFIELERPDVRLNS